MGTRPAELKYMYMYILGLVFGVIGGFITPAFSVILSLWLACSSGVL